jgi:hypothetical protein
VIVHIPIMPFSGFKRHRRCLRLSRRRGACRVLDKVDYS